MNRRMFEVRLAAVVATLCACLGFASVGAAGQVVYPALGNINFEQGTIEMWLVPQFDPEQRIEGEYWGRRFFQVRQTEDNYLALMWRATISGRTGDQAAGPFPTGRSEGERYAAYVDVWHRVGQDDGGWARNEPRHVAFCWDGEELWWVVDGEETRRGLMLRPFTIRPTEQLQIVLGDAHADAFVIRDFRISSVPRRPEELGYHAPEGLEPDRWTLLLDPLSEPFEADGQRETQPKVMMPSAAQDGGVPSSDAEFVETLIGTGLSL